MRADGSGRKRLTDHPRFRKGEPFDLANNPVWSPSGTKIMYTHFLPEKTVLVVMRPNGSGQHVVVGGRFGASHFQNKVDWGIHP